MENSVDGDRDRTYPRQRHSSQNLLDDEDGDFVHNFQGINVVDKFARIVFPVSYLLFNICYWIVYLSAWWCYSSLQLYVRSEVNIAQYLLRILLQLTSFRYIYIFLSSPVLSYRYHEGVWGGAKSSVSVKTYSSVEGSSHFFYRFHSILSEAREKSRQWNIHIYYNWNKLL